MVAARVAKEKGDPMAIEGNIVVARIRRGEAMPANQAARHSDGGSSAGGPRWRGDSGDGRARWRWGNGREELGEAF